MVWRGSESAALMRRAKSPGNLLPVRVDLPHSHGGISRPFGLASLSHWNSLAVAFRLGATHVEVR